MRAHRSFMAAALAGAILAIPIAADAAPSTRHATAALRDAAGEVVGLAVFAEMRSGGVQVVVIARGMTSGLHGLHVHTIGTCTAPTFASAGGHFNPLGVPHGSHAGDLPDLSVNPGGVGTMVGTSSSFTLLPGSLSLFDGDGSALVVHANADDHATDPSGNSGARIACGVITPLGG
jgi:Cu-Zn family superoxide dismutase